MAHIETWGSQTELARLLLVRIVRALLIVHCVVLGSQRHLKRLVVVPPTCLPCRLPLFSEMALVVFCGQSTSAAVHGDEMRQVAETIKGAAENAGWPVHEVHVCFPPDSTERKWAVYEPSNAEVVAHGGVCWRAERATTRVPRLGEDLWKSAAEAWRLVDDAVSRRGQVLLAGFSNGAIVATEYATTHPDRVRALLLLSGCPASSQQWSVRNREKQAPSTCVTCGTWERYFGGRAAFESVADDFDAELVIFEGGHCQEKAATLEDVTRRVLR